MSMNKRDRTKIEKGLERLTQLLRVLKEVRDDPCKGFDWAFWHEKDAPENKPRLIKELGFSPHYCGTRACVLGWAGLDPWFRSRGLVTYPPRHNEDGLRVSGGYVSSKRYDEPEDFFCLPRVDECSPHRGGLEGWGDFLFGANGIENHTEDLKEAMKRVGEAITMQKSRLV